MAADINEAAENARVRLRESLRELSETYAGEARAYHGLDSSVYVLYVIECFLQALANSPRGKDFVLKGGNLFRVWDRTGSFRPTGDLDMQCRDEARDFEDVTDLRTEVARLVDTEGFRRETGLVFPLGDFRIEPVRKGSLVAYRLDGKALLGQPTLSGPSPAEIPFCLEVTYGPPPEGAVELSRWDSVTNRGASFGLLTSKPEWMAAEKFHALVTRGVSNSRLKDYRDLALLLAGASFDSMLMQRCVHQVFEELGQTHLVPQAARGLSGLAPAFASSQNEFMWQRRRWPEWEGREWQEGRDPTLAQTLSAIIVGLERHGVFKPTPASVAAGKLADVCCAAKDLERGGLVPLLSGRFASCLKAFASASAEVPAAEFGQRWPGVAYNRGLGPVSAAEAFDGALRVARELGMMPAIDRGWDRGRGGGLAAVEQLSALMRAASRPLIAPLPAPSNAFAAPPAKGMPAAARTRSARPAAAVARMVGNIQGVHAARVPAPVPVAPPAKQGRRVRRPSVPKGPEELMAEGVYMLNGARAGTHVWFGGLAKVLSSVGANIPDPGSLALDMPEDGRAPYIWIHVAKRHGVEPDLDRAVNMAREILGLDMRMPARAL